MTSIFYSGLTSPGPVLSSKGSLSMSNFWLSNSFFLLKRSCFPSASLFISSLTNTSVFSISSDSSSGRPPADHSGKWLSASRLEGQRTRSEGLLAHLGGRAKIWPALLLLFASRFSVNAPHKPPPIDKSLCVTHLQDGTGGGTVLHGGVSVKWVATISCYKVNFRS